MSSIYFSDFDKLISDNFNQIIGIDPYFEREKKVESMDKNTPLLGEDNIFMMLSKTKGVGIGFVNHIEQTTTIIYDEHLEIKSLHGGTLNISIPYFKIKEINDLKRAYLDRHILDIINYLSSNRKKLGRFMPISDCIEEIEIVLDYMEKERK